MLAVEKRGVGVESGAAFAGVSPGRRLFAHESPEKIVFELPEQSADVVQEFDSGDRATGAVRAFLDGYAGGRSFSRERGME